MSDRIEAARLLLDRDFGRPPQSVDHGGTLTHEYVDARQVLFDRVAAIAARADQALRNGGIETDDEEDRYRS